MDDPLLDAPEPDEPGPVRPAALRIFQHPKAVFRHYALAIGVAVRGVTIVATVGSLTAAAAVFFWVL